jgi:hypothetical protein
MSPRRVVVDVLSLLKLAPDGCADGLPAQDRRGEKQTDLLAHIFFNEVFFLPGS